MRDSPEFLTQIIQRFPTTSWWVPALCAVTLTGVLIWGQFTSKNRNNNQRSSNQNQIKQHPEISIIIGHSGQYMESNSYNTVNVMKTVLIGVKNTGSTKLTNCKVMFEARNNETNVPEQWLRKEAFRLDVGAGIDIGLSVPPSGACWDPPNPRLPKDGGAVTITASSAESKSCSGICKLWVVDNKLHWAIA